MDKKERRLFARRCAAAARLRQCFETRFMERLGTPFAHIEDAAQALESLDLPDLRKKVELYAAARLHKHRHNITQRMQYELQAAREAMDRAVQFILKDREVFSTNKRDPAMRGTPVPTAANLIDDIKAMEREFAQWKLIEDELVITTDAIVIKHPEGTVDLGQFEIRLNLEAVERAEKRYKLVALQPNPKNGCVHPHIQGEQLCEGAAEFPIMNALNNGLLYDFFLIVRNTLIEYNPASPYVKLGYWTGSIGEDDDDDSRVNCAICSISMHPDDAQGCEDCGEAVCSTHSIWCEPGERTLCSSCIEYYKVSMLDARRSSGQCCDRVGRAGCHLHENPECEVCEVVPFNKDKIECELDSRLLCRSCATEMAQGDVDACDDCETAGHTGCALVLLGYPAKQEEGDGTTQESSNDGQEDRATANLEAVTTSSGEGDRAIVEAATTGTGEGGRHTVG